MSRFQSCCLTNFSITLPKLALSRQGGPGCENVTGCALRSWHPAVWAVYDRAQIHVCPAGALATS